MVVVNCKVVYNKNLPIPTCTGVYHTHIKDISCVFTIYSKYSCTANKLN